MTLFLPRSRPHCDDIRAQARIEPGIAPPTAVSIPHNHHGVEAMFKVMVYSRTEDEFFGA